MSDKSLTINGKQYISSKRAAEIFGYTNDYVGQLARGGKIDSTMVGRSRYVDFSSLSAYVQSANGAIKRLDGNEEASLAPGLSASTQSALGQTVPVKIVTPPASKDSKAELDKELLKKPVKVEPVKRSLTIREQAQIAPLHVASASSKTARWIKSFDAKRVLVGATVVLAALLFFSSTLVGQSSRDYFADKLASGVTTISQNFGTSTYNKLELNEAIAVNSKSFATMLDTGTDVDMKYLGFLGKVESWIVSKFNLGRDRVVVFVKDKLGMDNEVVVVQRDEQAGAATTEPDPGPGDEIVGASASLDSLTAADVRSIAEHVIDETLAERIDYFSQARSSHEGIVTSPLSDDPGINDRIENQVRSSFSDNVNIDLADDLSSGVITPVFRNGADDQYFFVIVPVDEDE